MEEVLEFGMKFNGDSLCRIARQNVRLVMRAKLRPALITRFNDSFQ